MDQLRRRRRDGGISMVEVMMALAILAGGLLVMLTMQIQAMKGGRHSRNATEAARIAQNQMEILNHQSFATIVATPGFTAPTVVNGSMTAGATVAAVPQTYNLSWAITANVDPNPQIVADTFMFDVRVNWVDPNASPNTPPRTYLLSTIRYDD